MSHHSPNCSNNPTTLSKLFKIVSSQPALMVEAKFIISPLPMLFLVFMSTVLSSESQPSSIIHGQGHRMQTYLVHVVKSEGVELLGDEELESWHRSFLPNTTLDSGEPRLVYSYRHAISGFAARLTLEEVRAIEAMEEFVGVEPDHEYQLETTYTPALLGLNPLSSSTWANSLMGEGIIIGVIDGGIPLNHPSFGDSGMPLPPTRWNVSCNATVFAACNNKIIRAMSFQSGKTYAPIDDNGHGTHVASIAAGNFVADAEVLGMAKGKASGIAPKAHLAIYKVCHKYGDKVSCAGSDIFAAIDQAVSDGVDVITMSISGGPNDTFYQDNVVFGSFGAVEKGISAVASAGNRGPVTRSLSHSAPWVMAVGASSTDRKIEAIVKLGNGDTLLGESAYQPTAITFNSSVSLPIVFPGINGIFEALYCRNGSLDKIDVRDKIVLCWQGSISDIDKGRVVDAAGGAAMIVMNVPSRGYTTPSEAHLLPVSHLNYMDGSKVRSYVMRSTNYIPNATIFFNGTRFGHRPSPAVAAFSSRGPSWTNGGILKPDVLAPGVNILAAWPFGVGPNPPWFATKTFNFLSGTSMAAPHVAGTIALLKSIHPGWSPAAIQSAIITSAQELDLDGNIIVDEASNKTAGIFATGAGQLNPSGAADPGLIYNLNHSDYIGYLCGLGYNDTEVTKTARRRIRCSTVKAIKASQLNYASITVNLTSALQSETIQRTVTNVGQARSTYMARIKEPSGVRVDLSSYQLQFSRLREEKTFTVTLTLNASGPGLRLDARGKLEWVSSNGKYVVGSPIAVSFV